METPQKWESKDGRGRRRVAEYIRHGYLPLETNTGHRQQVSTTMEYAYDDFVLSTLARRFSHHKHKQLLERSRSWKNVMDNSTGQWYVRGRYSNGSFIKPFNPFGYPSYITESTPFQYTWFVPQNVSELVEWFGGAAAFIDRLNFFFSEGHYDATNEPDIHVPFLFNYAGAAWLTQKWVVNLTREWYGPTAEGIPGNDDAGAMSAWYLFATVGFYPVCQGGGGGIFGDEEVKYIIGVPQFPKVTLTVQNGSLVVVANGLSIENIYIQSVSWNNLPYLRSWITHSMVSGGGTLVFEMGPEPSKWGSDPQDIPIGC
eukprot:c5548_g1_i2.p1 GENE.c5548_g1_i2~~c5548_g1_i2.p1  ORF type:complete len:314 (+),score=71.38 c5548_g1_i2:616-1557(+)